MATDAGPMYLVRDTGQWIFYFGWYDEATGEMLELSKSGYQAYYDANVRYGDFSAYVSFIDSFLGPGFTQKWGALGYFIRPEYLDRFSSYRPQRMLEGYIPGNTQIGQHDL